MKARNPIPFLNPTDDGELFLFHFGAYGTRCLVRAREVCEALDIAVDWLADEKPGLLMDEEVNEAYERAVAAASSAGKDPDAIDLDEVCADQTLAGSGHYIASWEWNFDENPPKDYLIRLARS